MTRNKIIGVILMLIVSMFAVACSDNKDKDNTNQSSDEETESTEEDSMISIEADEDVKGIEYPYQLDEGNLIINSLFQSSIENPDCNNEYADDIASLEIENQSGRFIESTDITLTLNDDSQLHMKIQEIPADQKVWVFECENTSLSSDMVCVSIDCDISYLDEDPLLSDRVTVSTEETSVTLVNQSGESLSGLTVNCHCLFDSVYYGGQVSSYSVDELAAGSSTVIEAEDCYLGTADVVRISE